MSKMPVPADRHISCRLDGPNVRFRGSIQWGTAISFEVWMGGSYKGTFAATPNGVAEFGAFMLEEGKKAQLDGLILSIEEKAST